MAASCSEESATVRQRTLEVVSSDTNFPVDGGQRTVTLARAAATAYAQDKWAEVRVENGQVIVKTGVNTDEQSRNTLLVGQGQRRRFRRNQHPPRGPHLPSSHFGHGRKRRSRPRALVPRAIQRAARHSFVGRLDYRQAHRRRDVTFKVTANTTGRPRVGWLLSRAHGLTDSVRITQATLSDIVGTYRQRASTLDSSGTRMVDTTNVVTISKISDTQAMFSIDGNLNWECEFKPGQGLS